MSQLNRGTSLPADSYPPLRETSSVTLVDEYLKRDGQDDGEQTVQFWRGDFFVWNSGTYIRQIPEVFRARFQEFLEKLYVVKQRGGSQRFKPEPRNIKNALEILQGRCQVYTDSMPTWLDDSRRPNVSDIIAFSNGLLNFKEFSANSHALLIPPTPKWFSEMVLPYRYAPDAKCPRWLQFLEQVVASDGTVDQSSIMLLQEWFGYCMTADTRHQKLVLMVGPPRSGKGTIIRCLQRVVGAENCASPALYSLQERFGLEPLLGKRVATIPDAHLGRETDAGKVLDKVLAITGEDTVTVERKFKAAIPNVRLGIRFIIACNEAPIMPDSSGAIFSRLMTINFSQSFAGREDMHLDEALAVETPGIAVWALDGLKRLRRNGQFTVIRGNEQQTNDYMRQSEPMRAFLQDRLELGTADRHFAPIAEMWSAWQTWAKANGHHPGSKEGMGRRLRTISAGKIIAKRVQRNGVQQYEYSGVRILPDGVMGELPFMETVVKDTDGSPF